jgi:hypothetical protein
MTNHERLPADLTRHAALLPTEREWLTDLPHEELSRPERHDLLVLVEAVLASRVPGFHLIYTKQHESAMTATRALCAGLLGLNGIAEPEKTKGFEWLMRERPAESLLAFYFRLRELKRQQEVAAAQKRLTTQLDLTPAT